ncbi:class I SAM-dependent methyltransferase [Methanococcoides sp. SA1]|nr:class I SAM-dependent methyltransferase [Methanococcoides sp. SA1]
MKAKLEGLSETMLIPLWAKAEELQKDEPIVKDYKAKEIILQIDYDFTKFKRSWMTQVGVSVRTMLLDRAVTNFLERNPNSIVINLGSGLDTRLERISSKNVHCWYDLDMPEGIKFRKMFFGESETNRFISKSILDFSWIDDIKTNEKPVLIIAEGLFMYFEEEELKTLFHQISDKLPGAEMLFEMLAPALVGKSKHHDSLNEMGADLEFKWGVKDSRELEKWSKTIQFIEEWNYFDYSKDRWKWFGVIARLPLFRSKMASRIVHINFDKGLSSF